MVLSGRPDTSSMAAQDEEMQQAALPPHAIVDIALPSASWRRLDRLSGWQHFADGCSSTEVAIRVAAFGPTVVFAVDWHGVRGWHAICTGLADGAVPGASSSQSAPREAAALLSCAERACIAPLPVIYLNFRVYATSTSLFTVPPDGCRETGSGPEAEAAFYRRMESSCMRAPHLAASVALCRADAVSLIALHAAVDPLSGTPFCVHSGQTLASVHAEAQSDVGTPARVAERRPPGPRLPEHDAGAATPAAAAPMFVLLPPLRSDIACLTAGAPEVTDRARPVGEALLPTADAEPEPSGRSSSTREEDGSVATGARCLLTCCVRLSPEKGAHRFAGVVQELRRSCSAPAATSTAAEPPGCPAVTQPSGTGCAAPSDEGCAASSVTDPDESCSCGAAGRPYDPPVPFLCGAAGDATYADAVRKVVAGGPAPGCARGAALVAAAAAFCEAGGGSAVPPKPPHADTASAETGRGRCCGGACGSAQPFVQTTSGRAALPAALLHALPEAAVVHASAGCRGCSGHGAPAVLVACPLPTEDAVSASGVPRGPQAVAARSACNSHRAGFEGGVPATHGAVSSRGIVATRFLGPTDMAQALRHTLLNMHPPDSDAYGMTIIEAAAFGAPTLLQLPVTRGDAAPAPSAAAPATCTRSAPAPEHRFGLRFEQISVAPPAEGSGSNGCPVVPAAPLRGFMRVAVSSDTSTGAGEQLPAATVAPAAAQTAAAIATLPEARAPCDSAGSARAWVAHLLATCRYPPVGACDLLGDPLPLESLLSDAQASSADGPGVCSTRPLDSEGLQRPGHTSEADALSAAGVAHAREAAILGVDWSQSDMAAGVTAVGASLRALFASPIAMRRLRDIGLAARQAALSWTEIGSAAAMIHLAETFGTSRLEARARLES
jgi:hypothetical protein